MRLPQPVAAVLTAALTACLAILVSGCGTAETPIVPVEPLPLPSPTGPPLSLTEAQGRFSGIAAARENALAELDAAMRSGRPWTAQRDILGKILAAEEEAARQLAGTPWPAEARPTVEILVARLLANRQNLSDAVHARSEREYVRRSNTALLHRPCIEANAVDAAFQLPPVCT